MNVCVCVCVRARVCVFCMDSERVVYYVNKTKMKVEIRSIKKNYTLAIR